MINLPTYICRSTYNVTLHRRPHPSNASVQEHLIFLMAAQGLQYRPQIDCREWGRMTMNSYRMLWINLHSLSPEKRPERFTRDEAKLLRRAIVSTANFPPSSRDNDHEPDIHHRLVVKLVNKRDKFYS